MTKKERYKELIKENNNVLNALSDDYRKVGYNYVKKARGYAVKSLDTEIRIKKVLEELKNKYQYIGENVLFKFLTLLLIITSAITVLPSPS